MDTTTEAIPPFLTGAPTIGDEIHVTGTWRPTATRRSSRRADGQALVDAWREIRNAAGTGVDVTVNPVVDGHGVTVHLTGEGRDALATFLSSVAAEYGALLRRLGTPDTHLVRGVERSDTVVAALDSLGIEAVAGQWAFGHERTDTVVDDDRAIQVTAIWAGTVDDPGTLDQLEYWWQRVATEALEIEPGLVRFEAYRIPGRSALLIHETFSDTKTLRFHLTKGTAAMFKKELDAIATPQNYLFRGPVERLIRTYSRFMKLPATYARR